MLTDGALLSGLVLGAVQVHRRGVRNDRIVGDQVRILHDYINWQILGRTSTARKKRTYRVTIGAVD